jgi:hypothetical protein
MHGLSIAQSNAHPGPWLLLGYWPGEHPAHQGPRGEGPAQKKKRQIGDIRGWVGGSEAKNGPGSDLFLRYTYFFTFLTEKRPKKRINKNREKYGFGFL